MNHAHPMSQKLPVSDSRCTKNRTNGQPCQAMAIAGTTSCRHHSGVSVTAARAKGNVVVELARWGLDGNTQLRDPGEVMLRLVTQSAARVELYSRLLGEAYEAADELAAAHEAEALLADDDPDDDEGEDGLVATSPRVQAARARIRQVFATGGVGALIGVKLDADRAGRVYATEEAIRGLAQLEAQERDRCANFASKAIAAGLAERQVRLAESQGAAMYAVFGRVLEGLGLTAEQAAMVPVLLAREIGQLTGSNVIEGSTDGIHR